MWHVCGKIFEDQGWGSEECTIDFASDRPDIRSAIDEAEEAGVFDIDRVYKSDSGAPEINFDEEL